jgi:hypothetical protein
MKKEKNIRKNEWNRQQAEKKRLMREKRSQKNKTNS